MLKKVVSLSLSFKQSFDSVCVGIKIIKFA